LNDTISEIAAFSHQYTAKLNKPADVARYHRVYCILEEQLVRQPSIMLKIIIILAVMAGNIAIDQGTKIWAREDLQGKPAQQYFAGIVVVTYAENSGAFLGLGSSLPPMVHKLLLILVPSIVTLLGLIWLLIKIKLMTLPEIIIVSSFLAGGASNLCDRIMYGTVTDFLVFRAGTLSTGILNVADMSLTFGALAFVALMIVREQKAKNAVKRNSAAQNHD